MTFRPTQQRVLDRMARENAVMNRIVRPGVLLGVLTKMVELDEDFRGGDESSARWEALREWLRQGSGS